MINAGDAKFAKQMREEGYVYVHRLPNGKWVGYSQMLLTGGLFVGLDDSGYEKRYCYETLKEAIVASLIWDGEGDPPGNWIKEKGNGIDRINPNLREL